MKKIIISLAVVVALAIAVAVGFVSCGGRKSDDITAEKKVEVVRRGDFQMRISATGNLEPLLDVEVKSNVEGEIIKLYVKEGDVVEKGDVLIDLDPEQIEQEKKQAQANVAAAKAQFKQAELNVDLTQKSLDSGLQQAKDNVKISESSLKTTIAESKTRITQVETDIQTTQNALAQDQIALEQAKIELNRADLSLSELKSSRDSAKVTLDNAESELQRNQDLFEKKLVAKKSLEDAESSRANASSQHKTSIQRVESQEKTVESQTQTIKTRERAIASREATLAYQKINLEKQIEVRQSQEEQSQLQLQIAQTRLKEITDTIENEKLVVAEGTVSAAASVLRNESTLINQEERLGWTSIKAPMAGTVTRLNVEEGEIVTSGRSAFSQSPPLMTIADLSKMVVKTYINEVDMERLRLDQSAEIKVDAYEKKRYKGRVAEIAPSGEERDNIITFEVMIEVAGSPSELRPGMSTDVDIITYEEKDVLLLPIDAVENRTAIIVTAQTGDAASDFKENQQIEIKNIAGKTFKGKVVSVGSSEVTISVDSSQRGLRPGQRTIELLVNGKQKLDGVTATIKMSKEKFVTLDEGSTSADGKNRSKGRKIPIETGMQNATEIIIKSGVMEGDRVILPPRKRKGPGGFGGRG